MKLLFRLSNPTSEPLWVLNWHTPLEGLHNNTIAFPGPLMDVATKKADVPHPFGESHPRQVRCAPVETTIVSAP